MRWCEYKICCFFPDFQRLYQLVSDGKCRGLLQGLVNLGCPQESSSYRNICLSWGSSFWFIILNVVGVLTTRPAPGHAGAGSCPRTNTLAAAGHVISWSLWLLSPAPCSLFISGRDEGIEHPRQANSPPCHHALTGCGWSEHATCGRNQEEDVRSRMGRGETRGSLPSFLPSLGLGLWRGLASPQPGLPELWFEVDGLDSAALLPMSVSDPCLRRR